MIKMGVSNKQQFLNNIKNGLCKNPSVRQVKRVLQESLFLYIHYTKTVFYTVLFKTGAIGFMTLPDLHPVLRNFLMFGS
jgi:hypothetical protein